MALDRLPIQTILNLLPARRMHHKFGTVSVHGVPLTDLV
jgi:hypothetical protein